MGEFLRPCPQHAGEQRFARQAGVRQLQQRLGREARGYGALSGRGMRAARAAAGARHGRTGRCCAWRAIGRLRSRQQPGELLGRRAAAQQGVQRQRALAQLSQYSPALGFAQSRGRSRDREHACGRFGLALSSGSGNGNFLVRFRCCIYFCCPSTGGHMQLDLPFFAHNNPPFSTSIFP